MLHDTLAACTSGQYMWHSNTWQTVIEDSTKCGACRRPMPTGPSSYQWRVLRSSCSSPATGEPLATAWLSLQLLHTARQGSRLSCRSAQSGPASMMTTFQSPMLQQKKRRAGLQVRALRETAGQAWGRMCPLYRPRQRQQQRGPTAASGRQRPLAGMVDLAGAGHSRGSRPGRRSQGVVWQGLIATG